MMQEPQSLIDVSLIEHMLSLSYEERIDAHEAARQLVNDLQQAGQDYYARQFKDSASKTVKS
jgi:hypothetical protein